MIYMCYSMQAQDCLWAEEYEEYTYINKRAKPRCERYKVEYKPPTAQTQINSII